VHHNNSSTALARPWKLSLLHSCRLPNSKLLVMSVLTRSCFVLYFQLLIAFLAVSTSTSQWIDYPPDGFATMTHYDLPLDYVASCGCTPSSTHYPTAALSQMAFGSSKAFGPGCGQCFNLTLLNTFLSKPPFYPNVTKSVVVKVTDLCPIVSDWCTATQKKPNQAGNFLNFDLAWPSTSIPNDFFPSNQSLYGYTDFGVWNVSYSSVSCNTQWEGGSDEAAQGAVTNMGTSVCCPADPFSIPNSTCGSFSDIQGIPPTASSGFSVTLHAMIPMDIVVVLTLFYLLINV